MALLAERYRLGEVLGSGGMARVHEATDEVLGRRVAIKVLPAGGAGDAVRERFLGEAAAAASFSHPNVVEIYDAGDDDGTLFIVMELIEGPSLATLLAERGPLGESEALGIMEQVLDALGAAHAAGMVHRDVKPANILLADAGGVKLVDFGIAKAVSDIEVALTGTDTIVGTVAYMAPEQTRGEPATPQSDLYAAGVMLFEMLVGSPPFTADTPAAVAMAHQQQPVPSVRDLNPAIGTGIADAIRRAMSKSQADRPQSAAEMQRELVSAAPTRTLQMPVVAADPTLRQPLPAPAVAQTAHTARQRWAAPLVAGLVIGALATALIVGASGSPPELPPETTADTDTTVANTTEPTEPTEPTDETTTTEPEPEPEPEDPLDAAETIGHLTDILAPDPRAYGSKGMDLLEGLHEVQEELSRNPRNKARDLLEDIEEWLEKGQLDERMARKAAEILLPVAR